MTSFKIPSSSISFHLESGSFFWSFVLQKHIFKFHLGLVSLGDFYYFREKHTGGTQRRILQCVLFLVSIQLPLLLFVVSRGRGKANSMLSYMSKKSMLYTVWLSKTKVNYFCSLAQWFKVSCYLGMNAVKIRESSCTKAMVNPSVLKD